MARSEMDLEQSVETSQSQGSGAASDTVEGGEGAKSQWDTALDGLKSRTGHKGEIV